LTYLNDGRTSSDGVVRQGLVATGDDDICLTGKAGGNGERVTAGDSGSRDVGRPSHGNEGGIRLDTWCSDEVVALVKRQ
jgi:hypothetical protein